VQVVRARAIAWWLWIGGLVCAGLAGLFILASFSVELPSRNFGFRGWVPIVGALWSTIGMRIAARQPRNIVGWLILAAGSFWCVNAAFEEYATFSYFPQELNPPLVHQMVWFNSLVGTAVAGIGGMALLVVPNGRLMSRRWYPVAVGIVLATIASILVMAVLPRRMSPFPFRNPYGIESLATFIATFPVQRVLDVIRGLVVVIPAVAVVLRLRAASGVERDQLRLIAFAAVYTAVLVFVYAFVSGELVQWAQLVGLVLVPLSFAISMRRYGMYEIDSLLNRTIVLGVSTALIAGLYTASIGIMQRLFVALTGEQSDAAVVLTTLLAAAAFTPVKERVQSFAKRTFSPGIPGTRGLHEFTEEIEAHLRLSDPERLLTQLLAESVATLGAVGGALEVRGSVMPQHTIGRWSGRPHLVAEVCQEGSVVARVMLAQRANAVEYDENARERLERSAAIVGRALDRIGMPVGGD
jgi:two-component system NarL family sensor kinase